MMRQAIAVSLNTHTIIVASKTIVMLLFVYLVVCVCDVVRCVEW